MTHLDVIRRIEQARTRAEAATAVIEADDAGLLNRDTVPAIRAAFAAKLAILDAQKRPPRRRWWQSLIPWGK